MKDQLENFMELNSEGFNDLEAPVDMWEKVSGTNNKHRKIKLYLLRGASVAAVLLLALMVQRIYFMPEGTKELTAFEQEMMETELFYNQTIEVKRTEVFQLTANNPELRSEVEFDLAEMDSVMVDLKKDLKDNVANVEVVEAMIQNYRMKLQLLEDILGFLKRDEKIQNKTSTYEL